MPILLPNLDDRTWADLVDEGRALIPFYASEWTDQNYSDPGITLMEQLASITEMDVFQLNRLTDRARLKFLSMVGIRPLPPRPSSTPLSFKLLSGNLISLPADVIFTGLDPLGVATPFRTLAPLDIVPSNLVAVQVKDGNGFRDLTDRWTRGIPFGIFGDVPVPGTELYLGFDQTLTAGQSFSLYFAFGGGRSDLAARRRLLAEAAAATQGCQSVVPACAGVSSPPTPPCPKATAAIPPFLGASTTWQLLTAAGWVTLSGNAIADDTRTFTLDGGVVLTPPQDAVPQKLGRVNAPLSYVRVRFESGAFDAPPIAQSILMNAVLAEQSAPVASLTWSIAAGVVASGTLPSSSLTGLALTFDAQGNISSLQFVADAALQFQVLAYAAATATDSGSLTVEIAFLGAGDGTPLQQFQIPQPPLKPCSLLLVSYEDGAWRTWQLRQDFDSSGRGDRDFLLDPTLGTITFGDGDHGVVPPVGAAFFASFLTTRADAGNVPPGTVNTLLDGPHNRALLPAFDDVNQRTTVKNTVAAVGGAAAETLGKAIGRTINFLAQPQRAVTLADYETLAIQTPGTAVARVKAWANSHPSFPCVNALGMVTVVILPAMPGTTPMPSMALRNAVSSYLNRRRIVGSRLIVVGPTYREVAVEAQVKSLPGASKSGVQQRVVDAINAFFDPLTGGPDGTGWPFGRDVYQAEVMQVVEKVQGVDYIASFDLLADGCSCAPQCGNICLAPGWLVAAGQHQIGVL